MSVHLPYVDPSFPWWKQGLLYLFNWIMWVVPAGADSVADDMGRQAQDAIASITILGLLLSVVVPILTYIFNFSSGWESARFAIGAYLFVGLIYHANEKWGAYS